MSFLERVTLVLMEDRMEEDGNRNMSTTKKGTIEISIVGSAPLNVQSDVNPVLRSSMLTAESTTYSRVCRWKLSRLF